MCHIMQIANYFVEYKKLNQHISDYRLNWNFPDYIQK